MQTDRTQPSERDMRARAEKYISSCSEYTDPSERERLINDWIRKGDVAERVVSDFRSRAGEPRGTHLLDVGFGNGLYTVAFSRAGVDVHGLEVNPVLLQIARENLKDENVVADLRLYDGHTFPFADNFFDYAFSVSVLEHVSDPRRLLAEVCRVLKPGGKFYLSFPNRLRPREGHTGVLLLSYLPIGWAEVLMRRVWKRNTVEELNLHFLSYWKLKRLLRSTSFKVAYEYEGRTFARRMLKRILGSLGIHHSAFLGTIMVVLRKSI